MKKLAVVVVLALAAVALVTCGSSSDSGSSNSATSAESGTETGGAANEESGVPTQIYSSTLELEADPNGSLEYTRVSAVVKAGKVTVNFNNPQSVAHDVVIEDSKGNEVGRTELVADGETSTTVNLKRGGYTYYCSVPGHREAGMKGVLAVKYEAPGPNG